MARGHIDKSRLWRRFLVLCGLTAAAVAAPLLDLYGKNPEVFVANRTGTAQIVLFGLLVTLVLPLVGLALMAASELIGPKTADIVYLALVAIGGVLTGLVIARQLIPDNTIGSTLVAIAVPMVLLGLFKYLEGVLRIFSIALPALLALFLAASPTSRLIWETPAAAAPGSDSIGNPKSIVFIQLDEFPTASLMDEDGSINEALFPNFARLANEGSWYRNALSVSMATTHSVPSILDGRLGAEDLSPTSIDHPDNLFTLLGDDYQMHVIEWVADLCPEEVCEDYAGRAPARFSSLLRDVGVVYGHLSLPLKARERLPSIDNTWKGFLGQDANPSAPAVEVPGYPVAKPGVRSEWIDWIQRLSNGITPNEPPTLSYAHLAAPHVPWQVNPSGTQYERPEQYSEVDGVQGSGFWTPNPDVARLGFQRHLYQLGFLDEMLGSLFSKLDETGNWDDTMIVVVADHGASFVAGQHRRWPYGSNNDDLYRVPLFVKYPNQAQGETVDDPAFTIDIVPTIVDALDITTDWQFDGISLREITGTDRDHQIIFWCCSHEGASTDLAVLFEEVQRNHEWIPDQSSWEGVASVGPYGSMVGRQVSELAPQVDPEVKWELDHQDEYLALDKSKGMVQTLITGRLQLPPGVTSDELLIAINGTVAGTGFISRDEADGGQIRGLVYEDALRDGSNEVSILVPDQTGTGWLTGVAADIAITFVADDGHVLNLSDEGNRRIQIDKADKTESGWTVVGWAADISRKVPADRIYVFAGSELVAFGAPNTDNPNVVRWYSSEDLLRSGFTFAIPAESVPPGVDRLTVIAKFGSVAIADPAILEE